MSLSAFCSQLDFRYMARRPQKYWKKGDRRQKTLELIESQEDTSDTYDPEEKYLLRHTGHRCGPHQGISLMVGPNLFWTKGFSGPALKKLKSRFQKDQTDSKLDSK